MRRLSRGFTLIELLVVIAILGFLAATLIVASTGLKQRAKIERTAALIHRIDAGCEAYFTKFQDYPSDYAKLTAADKKAGTLWAPIQSDKYLYDYLAQPLVVVTGFVTGPVKTSTLDPFVEFPASELSGPYAGVHTVQILDPWGGSIWYELPGFTHGAVYLDCSTGPTSSTNSRFDLTSAGPNGVKDSFSSKLNPKDDITNWNP